MKKKRQFILRKIAGSNVLVPVGETTKEFNGLITLNETAAFIWENIEKVTNADEMAALILDEFEVSEELAHTDAENFIKALIENGFVEA